MARLLTNTNTGEKKTMKTTEIRLRQVPVSWLKVIALKRAKLSQEELRSVSQEWYIINLIRKDVEGE